MSREIKFQLVRVADNKTVCAYQEGMMMRPDTGELYHGSMNVTDRYVRRQFTGLKDKNSVEIYDGDVMDWSAFGRYAVEWDDLTACFTSTCVEKVATEAFMYTNLFELNEDETLNSCEVIGNIYANPELLKGGE